MATLYFTYVDGMQVWRRGEEDANEYRKLGNRHAGCQED